MTPEQLGNILQAHLKAAADLQEEKDAKWRGDHLAAHNAKLEAAKLSASADRDARFAARLKKQEDEDLNK